MDIIDFVENKSYFHLFIYSVFHKSTKVDVELVITIPVGTVQNETRQYNTNDDDDDNDNNNNNNHHHLQIQHTNQVYTMKCGHQ
jgi:hypothetical protein